MANQKIVPHLWFDKEAKEAAEFYTSVFPNSKITHAGCLKDTPSGDCDILSFELDGYEFMAISAGPYFKINPSISFFVNFDPSRMENAREKLDEMWEKLSEGGSALMPLDEYPFSKRYGWIQDKYGVSWQLILTNPEGEERPFIVPSMLFVQNVAGRAEEAIDFYTSIFNNSKKGQIAYYPPENTVEKEGNIMFGDFMIENQWFAAMDSSMKEHQFGFNEAISLLIKCENQDEIDYFWEKLSYVPEAEQCGWVKDKFGVSWQIHSTELEEMLKNGSPEQIKNVTGSFLNMKKFDIAKLKEAYEK